MKNNTASSNFITLLKVIFGVTTGTLDYMFLEKDNEEDIFISKPQSTMCSKRIFKK